MSNTFKELFRRIRMDERLDRMTDALYSKFFSHLIEHKISYFDHMKRAFSISAKMFICGAKTVVHGVFPYFWSTAATDTVEILHNELHSD